MNNRNLFRFIIVVIALVMLNNIEKIAFVHFSFSHRVFPVLPFDWLNKAHSIMVVVIIELSIMVFVLKGWHWAAAIFTACIFMLNLAYYDIIALWQATAVQDIISKVLLSFIYTFSIYVFAILFKKELALQGLLNSTQQQLQAEQSSHTAQMSKLEQERSTKKQQIADLEQQRAEAEQETAHAEQTFTEKQQYWAAHTCPYCQEYADENEKALAAHKGRCEKKPVLA